jgi:hypothetical protein
MVHAFTCSFLEGGWWHEDMWVFRMFVHLIVNTPHLATFMLLKSRRRSIVINCTSKFVTQQRLLLLVLLLVAPGCS